MEFDGSLNIAVGRNRTSRIWQNKDMLWSQIVDKLEEVNHTNETLKEFFSATKEEQDSIKDVGGYVGGYLRAGRRKPENVVSRQLLTLDVDFAHMAFWDDFCLQFDNAAVLHATHKHHEGAPRFRLVMPLNRECAPDEYVAIGRKVAGTLGIDLFDNTTFETNRLMYWPSSPKDVEYFFRSQDGPWLDADRILGSYPDWHDSSLWPTSCKKFQEVAEATRKQEDPTEKKGIIGAFCRAYTISEVIKVFLSDVYSPTDKEDRYTYIKGSAASGLIVYDDKFAYSHHGTDPAGSKLSNAFDLVRVHRFGHLDDGLSVPNAKLKSFKAMEDFAREDKEVKKIIAVETIQEAKYDFASEPDPEEGGEPDLDWMQELEVDSKKNYLSTAVNIGIILSKDPRLKGKFRYNEFDDKSYVFSDLPWRRIPEPEPLRNVDFSGVRNYLESIYGIIGSLKIDDCLMLELEKNRYHPVREYLNSLKWDGRKRVDTLLIDLFGANDSQYTREAMRKWLVGGVARVFRPGVKFDLVLTLISQMQGTGKSSFLKALGGNWFSDSFLTVQGKEAFEQLHGKWIIEIAELSGLKKAEVESVKHFMSKQEDSFRPAYGRAVESYPRQCLFAATTNDMTFLRDSSGNRRFLPIDILNIKLTDNKKLAAFISSKAEIDQVWAEAVQLYINKEPLYLSPETDNIAVKVQMAHLEVDDRIGMIYEFINRQLPEDWDSLDIYARRDFINDPLAPSGTRDREYICSAEIWCECFGKNKEDMDKYKTRELNDMLRVLSGWEPAGFRKFRLYGKQRCYARTLD